MQIDLRHQEMLTYSEVPFGEVFQMFEQIFIKDNEGGGTNLVTGTYSRFDVGDEVLLIPGRFVVDV